MKAPIQRPNATISGNSMWIQRRLKAVYGLASDPMKGNGETPKRDEHARPLEATHLMHVIDLDAWPTEASAIEQEDLKNAPPPPTPYVMTVGRASHVKGTWETLRSLNGTGFGLVQVGGGDTLTSLNWSVKPNVWVYPWSACHDFHKRRSWVSCEVRLPWLAMLITNPLA